MILHYRHSLRAKRKQLSADNVMDASLSVAEKIIHLPEFLNSQHIAYYLPHENEIDTQLITEYARDLGKSLYLPIFSGENNLNFYPVNDYTQYKINKWGIAEPIVSEEFPVFHNQFDLILIPLVAFDMHCNRLGRGAGCYDRYLAFTLEKSKEDRPALIGLAYEFQKITDIIQEKWDVPMDFIVTERAIYSA
ncbi:MAG: 5-formyltetrahydrofolate cyclo-ligase [Gammaproteobacteria bacterium RIFCSPHIGHO2_12_FULL_38_11]|nr:MAG: 5-formyltetrahydrofolate cyclo-ligase [Gammaproteobacteria bacterium RIFCSPHIGHO2_12_FULL_38_11]